ncbi:hypothetical protein UFOVP775_7 [uncultured Caudovirales phage]|jgi:hypothetical protein|uniref:Uncharacterized protein n=1 Tax=uncultured Caudovirales phage TaxID=2100421 RepID=A0A6J5P3C9_9CAUD|nr:hypothetical protein UFOVP775_7 [uncultured Caudovirales phage]
MILHTGKQKVDYRKIKNWKIKVNVKNKFYKNYERD